MNMGQFLESKWDISRITSECIFCCTGIVIGPDITLFFFSEVISLILSKA